MVETPNQKEGNKDMIETGSYVDYLGSFAGTLWHDQLTEKYHFIGVNFISTVWITEREMKEFLSRHSYRKQ